MLIEITRTICYIKRLIDWIDKPPFYKQTPFNEIRDQMLKLGLEIATCAQREKFTENPVRQLHQKTEKLAKLADWMIQSVLDPMLLQPSTLVVVTLKKRESELGFYILPSVYGVHKITEITNSSPAHNSAQKIEEGDEIVQINYQTVVGWNRERVLYILRECPPDVLLTIRKRPRHTKMYGQIYIKPYRLPSKKRAHPYRWGESVPSPRGDFLNTHDFFPCLKSLPEKQLLSDSELSSSESDAEQPPKLEQRANNFYNIKIHRRHSICCDGYSMLKLRGTNSLADQRMDDSPSLRDKSVSFGFGLEATGPPRPTTHLGIGTATIKEVDVEVEKPQLKERKMSNVSQTPPQPKPRTSQVVGELEGISKVVRFDSSAKLNDSHIDSQYTCNVENTLIETFVPIPYADDEEDLVKETPPAIEPRVDKKKPVPPPRPSKKVLTTLTTPVTLPQMEQFEPPGTPTLTQDDKRSKLANVVDLRKTKVEEPTTPVAVTATDSLELLIQMDKSKNLTLKKKNSLISKRRKAKVTQLASNSDIQGHLYRRTKSRQGASYWSKLYILLIDTALYGFKTKTSTKATCLIFLPGFTVTKAQEVHSKSFAFKVYHPEKTFYFAAETEEAQKQWIDFINQATLKSRSLTRPNTSVDVRELFSETESSEDEASESSFTIATPSPLLHATSKKNDSTPTSRNEGKYHLGFGSLKKSLKNLNSPSDSSDNKSDSKFKSLFSSSRSSAERKNSIDVPVPTSQFKSYRKMPVSVDLQSGTVTINPRDELPPPSPKVFNYDKEDPIFDEVIIGEGLRHTASPPVSSPKPSYNYMHASNPNLLDFQTFSVPKPNFESYMGRQREGLSQQAASTWEGSQSLTGFVTLKDLMLQKQAEDAQEMYNKRVCLGIEKSDDRNALNNSRKTSVTRGVVTKNEEHHIDNEARSKINKIQLRSLPVTPDYAQSFKPDDQDILYTRSREGQKLRDFGYELISGDDRTELKNNLAAAAAGHDVSESSLSGRKKTNKVAAVDTKKRTMNWIGTTSAVVDKNSGSMKKTKNKSGVIEKFDHLVASSEKLFHFRQHNETESLKVKQTSSKPAVVATNWNLVEPPAQQQDGDRTTSYFTKLSFANRSAKEKKLLGSPRLHRAIFGNRNHHDQSQDKQPIDHEVFLPLNFTKVSF